MAESEEELKSHLMKVREESEKAGLKLSIQEMKIIASGPVTSWQIEGETMETVTDFIFLAFFIVQLSQPYMTTRKTIALTRQAFVGKIMSLLFSMLFRLVIAFFPKEQVSFNFMAAVTICSDFGAPQNKVSVSIISSSICHEVMGPDAMILDF